MGDSIQPCLDLIFHRLPYWIDYFGIPLAVLYRHSIPLKYRSRKNEQAGNEYSSSGQDPIT